MKTIKKALSIILILILSMSCLCGCEGSSSSGSSTSMVYDLSQFANISSEELIELLGNPKEQKDGICEGDLEIPCIYYDYDLEVLGSTSFCIVNNQVVRCTAYNDFQYLKGKHLFERFGIEETDQCTKAEETSVALEYRWVNDNIQDFWISLIDKDADTFGFIQATYQDRYYREFYIPVTSEERTACQTLVEETIKASLKSPSTAKFGKFSFGKNDYYLACQSYVEGQNSFGATIRNEFTFVYKADSPSLVYEVFDGNVVVNNDYTETIDLLIQSLN